MDVIVTAQTKDWDRALNRVCECVTLCEAIAERQRKLAARRKKLGRGIVERFMRRYRSRIKWYYRWDAADQIEDDHGWRVSVAVHRANKWTQRCREVTKMVERMFDYHNEPTKIVLTSDDITLLDRIERHAKRFGYTDSE